jgi:hypothetical protein
MLAFRPVDLDPTPAATGVNEQTTFERHLGHMRKGDGTSGTTARTSE